MLSFIKGIFSSYNWVIVLLVLSIGVGFYFHMQSLYNQINDLTEQNTTLTTSLDNAKDTIKQKDEYLKRWSVIQQEQEHYRDELKKQINEKNQVINGYKNRQDVVYKKPGLVQIKEQKALDKFFNEVSDE